MFTLVAARRSVEHAALGAPREEQDEAVAGLVKTIVRHGEH